MDISGLAALLALAGIPVSVLVARWQMRTALRQAEASHRTALEVAEAARQSAVTAAEASHRSALELAEASHRRALEAAEVHHHRALELVHQQAEADRVRWLTEARRAEYMLLQNALAQFRRALFARHLSFGDVQDAFIEVHQAELVIQSVGPEEVFRIAQQISMQCRAIAMMRIPREGSPPWEVRETWWSEVRPFRDELLEAVSRVLDDPRTV